MKKVFGKSCFLLLLAMTGCGLKTSTQEAQNDVKVQIPIYLNGQAQIRTVTLAGIQDLRRVSGAYAFFVYSPRIQGRQVEGELVQARFLKTKDGVFVPTDSASAELASIYYHMQGLAAMDQRVGLSQINSWPRRVAMATKILRNGELEENNSFYDQDSDTMIFIDFKLSSLPLAFNMGVLAHEHFHSLFSKLVLVPLLQAGKLDRKIKTSNYRPRLFSDLLGAPDLVSVLPDTTEAELTNSLYEFVMFKALNEGLADYWGWAYSQDANFVARSIPKEGYRGLDKPVTGFPGKSDRRERIEFIVKRNFDKERPQAGKEKMLEDAAYLSYVWGNQYSRFFKQLSKDKDLTEAQIKIVSFLQGLQEKLMTAQNKDGIEPEEILKSFPELEVQALPPRIRVSVPQRKGE